MSPFARTPTHFETAQNRERLALDIIRTLRSHGHSAYLVGGCVRDHLLGITPADYDVSTDAIPADVLRYFPRAQQVGAHFGVLLVGDGDPDSHVEVATFRSEGKYSDGRRPDAVRFESDPRLDVLRRDFTINGLLLDPFSGTSRERRILDYVGGRADLDRKLIRAIGHAPTRFEEDHLRMLRAVRFAARLGFNIETATLEAIQAAAHCILNVSAERIRDELLRILTEGNASRGLQLLDETGLLAHVLPEVKAFQGVAQPPEFHPEGDVWTHVVLMLDHMHLPSVTLAAGVLLHDVGKPLTFRIADRIRFDGHAEVGARMTQEILSRLHFSNEDSDQITSLVANHMRFKDVRQMRTSTLKRFLCLPRFSEHLELHRLDCLASNGYTDSYEFVKQKLAEFSEEELRPPKLLSGRDLIGLGFKPGPRFREVLMVVESAQLDGDIHTSAEAIQLARTLLQSAG